MRKFLLLFVLILINGISIPALFAEEVEFPNLLEVSGVFIDIDETEAPHLLILDVNGQEASGPLLRHCRYINERGKMITREIFIKHYLKRVITVEIIEDTGEVFSCRVNS